MKWNHGVVKFERMIEKEYYNDEDVLRIDYSNERSASRITFVENASFFATKRISYLEKFEHEADGYRQNAVFKNAGFLFHGGEPDAAPEKDADVALTEFDDILVKFDHVKIAVLVHAGKGDDAIDIRDGDDLGDEIHGEDGNDTIYTGSGKDKLYGGRGNDVLNGGRGGDILDGGEGHDFLFSGVKDREKGNSPDYLTGGAGRDIFFSGPIDSILNIDTSNWLSDLTESKAVSGVFITGSVIKESASVVITSLVKSFRAIPYAGPIIGIVVDLATRGLFLGSRGDEQPEEAVSFENVAVVTDLNPPEGDVAIQHFKTVGFRNVETSLDNAAHALLVRDADVTLMRIGLDPDLPSVLEKLLQDHGLQESLPSQDVLTEELLKQVRSTSLVLYKEGDEVFFATLEEVSRGEGRLSDHRDSLASLSDHARSANERAIGEVEKMLDGLQGVGQDMQNGEGMLVFGNHGGVFYELEAAEKNTSSAVGSDSADMVFAGSVEAWVDARLDLTDHLATRALVFGLAGDDRLYGHGGRDIILGGEGDDEIAGGAGSDSLFGDEGSDTIYCGRSPQEVIELRERLETDPPYGAELMRTALRNATDDFDNFASGGDGNDRIFGSFGADKLHGDAGHDTLYANPNDDILIDGGEGIDTLRFDRNGLEVDFTQLAAGRVKGIEWLDIRGGGSNTIVLDEASIAQMSSDEAPALYIRADNEDLIEARDFAPIDDPRFFFDSFYSGYVSGGQTIFVEEGAQVYC